ncbi:hypothetical protein CU669_02585 [Paramagnetospirillum kuznetsovii]|uniref:histidine kinase n=1 Tax=Paramagnetospirillum kuznetsovii TaxID=2053833 RepID=A0A364P3Q2_9PROT|nr:ATP-binding protein [Paramagnetospirillum kuznetsovii]RAU23972.1 hypothetical protein CU669_02585 [Paramagnetospirillum kuznetsovii]
MAISADDFTSSRHGGTRKLVVALAVAAIMTTWTVAAAWLWFDRTETMAAAKESLWSRAVVTAEQTERLFSVVDMTFAGISEYLAANPAVDPITSPTVNRLVEDCVGLLDSTLSIRMIDTGGAMYLMPKQSRHPAAMVPDRDYFREAQAGKMLVFHPVFSRITSEWTIPAARRLDRPASGIGIVAAAIHTKRLGQIYDAVRVGGSGTVGLYRDDGTLLARAPLGEGLLGRKFANLTFQRLGETATPESVAVIESSPVDGIPRLVASRAIKRYDMILVLTSSLAEVLEPWRHRLTLALVGAAFITGMIIVGTGMLWRLLRQLQTVAQDQNSRIRELSDFNSLVVDHSPLALLAYAEDGGCVLANQAAADLVGASRDQMLTQNFRNVRSWRESGLLDVADDVLAHGGHRHIELQVTSSFGKLLDMEGDLVAFVARGKPHLLLVASDISNRVRGEREVLKAKEEAEQANSAKSKFLANFSHELRTPLNAILGFSDALLSGVFGEAYPPRCTEYIGHINDAGQHLLSLIDDILDISIIEAGRLELHTDTVDLSQLYAEAVEMVRARAASKNLTLQTNLPPVSPKLRLDGRRMRQVLVNLLVNAIKFTPVGGAVTLGAVQRDDGGVHMVVADNGVGMDADGIAKAMKPFGQLGDPAIRREQGGVGLGLPLSRQLVELHGGTLAIDSVPGVGTVVTITLPADAVV